MPRPRRSAQLHEVTTKAASQAIWTPDDVTVPTGGHEIRQVTSGRFDVPIGIQFHGQSLLVANSAYFPLDLSNLRILRVFVGETSLPLIRPRLSAISVPAPAASLCQGDRARKAI